MEIVLDLSPAAQHYSSRIEGITSSQMHLAMPMNKSVPIVLQPGNLFYGRTLTQGSIWQFSCTFIDKQILPVPIWISGLPFDLKKVQLRSFVRLPVALPVTYQINIEGADEPPARTSTRDLSGGGLQLIIKRSLPPGTTIDLALDIPEFGPITAKGAVVRVDRPQDTNVFWVAIKFILISEKDREKIIKFIFKKQLELRQKGL
ncbi:MAG: PilZ domain-containing protein [Negativicutes bacterium]|nr:PilZ domain-containing protein [Negativicutes bacterium]